MRHSRLEVSAMPGRPGLQRFYLHAHTLLYNREQGFFVGALYLAYGMGIPILLASMVLAGFLLHLDFFDTFWYSLIIFMPFTPWLFRYSRVIWLHIIEHYDPLPSDPRDASHP
jgi:hypothetical protein